jgi:hypothetical protein
VDIVVQWKAPTNLSSWVQRAGCAVRAPGHQGLAVMIVEKSAFEVDVNNVEEVSEPLPASTMHGGGRGRGCGCGHGRGHGRVRGKRGGASYGIQRGQKCGTHSGTFDIISPIDELTTIADDAHGEGLYSYILTTICCRAILTQIFGNTPPGKSQHSAQVYHTKTP